MAQVNEGDGSHVTYEFVKAHLNEYGQCKTTLAPGESGWNPASTKRPIYGPANVDYTLYPDGGWHAHVEEIDGWHESFTPGASA